MRVRITVVGEAGSRDLVVTADAAATVGDVADGLVAAGLAGWVVGAGVGAAGGALAAAADGTPAVSVTPASGAVTLSLLVPGSARPVLLRRATSLAQSGVRSGATVRVVADADPGTRRRIEPAEVAARLEVLGGPDVGTRVDLPAGESTIGTGEGCDVRITDATAARLHARIVVGQTVEIINAGSVAGVHTGDGRVDRAVLGPDDVVMLGSTSIQVRATGAVVSTVAHGGAAVAFNRSPRVVRRYPARSVSVPTAPEPATPGRFPLLALVAPLVMGLVLFQVTGSATSLVFVGLSPVLALGTYLDKRIRDAAQARSQAAVFRRALAALRGELDTAHADEQVVRAGEEPSTADAVAAAFELGPVLWSRRQHEDSFLSLRVGVGSAPSRTTIERSPRGRAVPELWAELDRLCSELADVDDVPLVVNLRECGSVGVAGEQALAAGLSRSLVAQLVCLHSPAELIVTALVSQHSAAGWDWLRWLPHTASAHSPLPGQHLAAGPVAITTVTVQIEELIAARASAGRDGGSGPAVVVIVEDDAPMDRGRVVRIAERGAAVGVHVLWCAPQLQRLPAACRSYVELAPPGVREARGPSAGVGRAAATLGSVDSRSVVAVVPEEISARTALEMARHLSAVVDAGAPVLDESDIPRAVSGLALAGVELATDPTAVIGRWQQTAGAADGGSLRALVGVGAEGDFLLDLRAQGPHALVGGTTGSGKSEFLQAWVLGMAAAHSPARVSFLFVDYKGGAAFADCVDLPHAVGLVTDLSPHLVRRALASLRAELRRRELLLARKRVKDLLSLELSGDPDTPPALVVVVDEFAALATEVPEFVDGMIDVAQRGRSLGLHLILATQRPAGVIKDNLRANTNLRIGLRMADEQDSVDVLGTAVAAHVDPSIPGRAAVRTGPDRVAMFQTGYLGGQTPDVPPRPAVEIAPLAWGPSAVWSSGGGEVVRSDAGGPGRTDVEVPARTVAEEPARRAGRGRARRDAGLPDIARVVSTITAAASRCGIPAPRRPWLPELGAVVDMEGLLAGAGPDPTQRLQDTVVPWGLVDLPEQQAQRPAEFLPDEHGSMLVVGVSGSGKSALLRTLAAVAGEISGAGGGPVHVYCLDYAGGGLVMLEQLPHVGAVIEASDTERVGRLLRWLRELLDGRAAQFAERRVGSIGQWRAATGQADLPRILLLLDGLGAFRDDAQDDPTLAPLLTILQRLAAEGRSVGIHLVMSADRPGAVPTAVAAAVPHRVVLRQADESTYLQLAVARDVLTQLSPPGRGVVAGTSNEVQVAVVAGTADIAAQAAWFEVMAARLSRAGVAPAPEVARLPRWVPLDSLPTTVGDRAVVGLDGETLAPAGLVPAGAVMIAGPPGSGRSTALAAVAAAVHRALPAARLAVVGQRRSLVRDTVAAVRATSSPDEAAALAAELLPLLGEQADPSAPWVLVVEALTDLLGTTAERPMTEAIRAARRNGHLVVAEAETAAWGSSWGLVTEVRNGRRGIVLQPDQSDGEVLFHVPFPRVQRAAFPEGRGMLVDAGRATVVQVAVAAG